MLPRLLLDVEPPISTDESASLRPRVDDVRVGDTAAAADEDMDDDGALLRLLGLPCGVELVEDEPSNIGSGTPPT